MTARSDSFSDAKELSRLDDPIVCKRCTKLKRQSDVQSILLGMTILLLMVSFFLFVQAGSTSRSGRYHPVVPALIPYGMASLALSLATLISLLCYRNFYLLDPQEHRLYHQFQFLWWQRRQIVFRQGEVFAITTAGRKKISKYGAYWEHRLTAVGMNGQQEPLSDWRRNGLETWNAKACTLAKELGCQSISSPPQSKLSVQLKDGKPFIQFNHFRSFSGRISG
jgi:hypothetical protein